MEKIDKKKMSSLFESIKKDKEAFLKFKDNVLIVDGNNLIMRVWMAQPDLNVNGNHVGGIVGSLKSLGYAIKLTKPTRLIVVFDGKGGSFKRRQLYPEYKGQRKMRVRVNRIYTDMVSTELEDESLVKQILRVIQYLNNIPCRTICIDDIEADDTIAYISQQALPKSRVTIMSTDKDFLQLVDDRVKVWSPSKKKLYGPDEVKAEYGVASSNFVLYRAIDGDVSDNINGVPYAGPKVILKHFPILAESVKKSVEDMFKFAAYNAANGKFYNKFLGHRDLVERNFKLMQLGEVDIAVDKKLNILDIVSEKIPRLNKAEFLKMLANDAITESMNNASQWASEVFSLLDVCADSHNKEIDKKTTAAKK